MKLNKTFIIPLLFIGVLALATSSIFIKLCTASAVIITAYRLSIASLFYIGISEASRRPLREVINRKNLLLAFGAGTALAFHFITWISSFSFTSVSSSAILVQLSPVFVAIGSYFIYKEKFTSPKIIGIALTLVGTLIIGIQDFWGQSGSLVGNLLAITGALGSATYFLIGKKLRTQMDVTRYVSLVYSFAALWALIVVAITKQPLFNYSATTFGYLIAIAVFPQIIGHTTMNWALSYFSATTVAIIILGEPVGTAILAMIILGEQISLIKIIGGLVILVGVALTIWSEKS